MQLYADQLDGKEIYWGVSPVMGERSQSYWENRNKAFFPKGFVPTLEWNRDFAKEALDFVKSRNENIYFITNLNALFFVGHEHKVFQSRNLGKET